MSEPRPSEADVEALAKVIRDAGISGVEGDHVGPFDLARADAVLASDWLAARDAEHEREVAALRERKETYHEQWMLTERALADRDAAIKALWEKWQTFDVAGNARAHWMTDLRALLPRDDAAGAGGGA